MLQVQSASLVLLAEMLSVHYPKLVEMHNYPPRNSHSLKLNNWMTLNRKVLKKLKLKLCCNTMEQLANCAPGVIERVLVMVRDKIRRDEEANKSNDSEQNVSSGGSYYEAIGDDEHVLVVPVKKRVNGVLETVQQKVVNYDYFLALKEEHKDLKEMTEVLKQKVEHLDSLIKLKEKRIDELQKQLERKQVRRKEVEAMQNSLAVPFETVPSPIPPAFDNTLYPRNEETANPVVKVPSVKSIEPMKVETKPKEESKIPIKQDSSIKFTPKSSLTVIDIDDNLDRIKSNVFKDIEIIDERTFMQDVEDFKDSQEVTTIEDTIQQEIKMISYPIEFAENVNC